MDIMQNNPGLTLACINILLSFFSGVGYFYMGDWRRGVYWMCGAVLTSMVTMEEKR